MKWCTTFVLLGVVCTFVCSSPIGEDGGVLRPAPRLAGGDILGKYDHHTYAIRFKLSNNTRSTKGFKYCSGVRLNDGWLMTAAECLQIPSYKYVRITSPDGFEFKHYYYEIEDDPKKRTRPPLTFKIHPKYNSTTRMFNIALVKSDFVTVPHQSLNPVLPYTIDKQKEKNEDLLRKTPFVTSYENIPGRFVDDDKEYVKTLRVLITDHSICKIVFFPDPSTTPRPTTTPKNPTTPTGTTTQGPKIPPKPPTFVNSIFDKDNFFCIATPPAQGVQRNDLGAPLVLQKDKFSEKKLIGISVGVNMISGNQNYALFARLHTVLDWIAEITGITLVTEPKRSN